MKNLEGFVNEEEIRKLQEEMTNIHNRLERAEGPGSDFLGWLNLPAALPESLLNDIAENAHKVRGDAEAFICIGIGGSYLGAKAAIEFVNHAFHNRLNADRRAAPEVYFAGQNISSDYLSDLIEIIDKKSVYLNVISKSGTTTEPAIAFRILRDLIEKRYGKDEARKRIIVTTDEHKGALKEVARQEGYQSFVIPDDVGGRFSVLTPVGLFPIAVAGIDITKLVGGAKKAQKGLSDPDVTSNPACRYAAVRNILYQKGKVIEILASFHPSLHYIGEWWKQLAGESEGKDRKGIYPATVDFTTDLHSMGQWIQEGNRIIFETFITIEKSNHEIIIPHSERDDDGLNYISGKSLDDVNDKAYRGTAMAHREGGVPNMTISLKDRSPDTLGQLFYFFEKAVAVSGNLLRVNPFDQPGVEFYKKNMFALLGKK